MREVTLSEELTKEIEEKYYISDWKDINGLLENIDKALEAHGLELVVADAGDDNYWVCIEKRKKK